MKSGSPIRSAIGEDRIRESTTEASRRRLYRELGVVTHTAAEDQELQFVVDALELQLFDYQEDVERRDERRSVAAEAFQVARTLDPPKEPMLIAEWLLRLGCLAVLGDRAADFRRYMNAHGIPLIQEDSAWGIRVWSTTVEVWLRIIRKSGWEDLDAIQRSIASIRDAQNEFEPDFLHQAEIEQDPRAGWDLMSQYHLAKAAELLGDYLGQGSVQGRYDIREQVEAQFDRAINAAIRGRLIERESVARLLAATASVLIDNSIWTVTRAVNSRVTKFVRSLTSRDQSQPIFEMLPPQRRALREKGLLGSSHRSVVVSLPTSSGKTLVAQFRILQALNQFDSDGGWVAYLAPTRALVNQLTVRLRRDFSPLGIPVEKVSPALEIDGLEAEMLAEKDVANRFQVLVTTPEKLDLMIRGGWEEAIGRPLTLVVVDEAHGLATPERGLKLELLLATVNRECRDAQFLLLTPFINNGEEIARWLSPDSSLNIELGVDWTPNDRVVSIARVSKGKSRGDYSVSLKSRHTSRETLEIPEAISIGKDRPLGLSWSAVSRSPSKIAAATAQLLKERGTVIVLADSLPATWSIANEFRIPENKRQLDDDDLTHIQKFLADEMGEDFPLAGLLEYGIGVHHAGMSEDTRALVEWLAETNQLNVLIATTTIAQGVNFPVSGVVFASHQYKLSKFPFRQDMPPADFWNIAGRAGRVNQGDLGIVALAAQDDKKESVLEQFIDNRVGELNSTLINMVREVEKSGRLLNLESLSFLPGWSAFVQYLAHSYRQIGNHEEFAAQIEQVLRGTLGFQELRKSHAGWANELVRSVNSYAERIKGKPLSLVDATGFSWESVSNTLLRLGEANLSDDVWSPQMFGERRDDLRRMMGLLLDVPELRDPLREVTGGQSPDGDKLARIISDWVQGRPLPEMAIEYFGDGLADDIDSDASGSISAITKCCKNVFGRLTQTASWGLSALQSLTLVGKFDSLSIQEQRNLRNLPARVFYGVNSDEAVALRLLGVPRTAAPQLAERLDVLPAEPLHKVRAKLRGASKNDWLEAMGEKGATYHRVWSILEGET